MNVCRVRAPRHDLVRACDECGHTNLLHRGDHNPDLDECMICALKALLPPKQDPHTYIPEAGLPTVLLHLVVEPGTWRIGATLDQATANAKAQEIQGVVGDIVASADYRPRHETPSQKHSRETARRVVDEHEQRRDDDQG